jgi:hypothetical protein
MDKIMVCSNPCQQDYYVCDKCSHSETHRYNKTCDNPCFFNELSEHGASLDDSLMLSPNCKEITERS